MSDDKVDSIILTAEREGPKPPPSHEGFPIDKDFISHCSKSMSRMNATTMKLYLTESANIMNRDLLMVILEPKRLTLTQRFALWFFRKVF